MDGRTEGRRRKERRGEERREERREKERRDGGTGAQGFVYAKQLSYALRLIKAFLFYLYIILFP